MQRQLSGSHFTQVLERCMMEALRLFPPLIMLLRQAKASFAVTTSQGKTYVIPKVGASREVSGLTLSILGYPCARTRAPAF